jgi:two-component system, cell cycle sensor histidine kinase and response regulator CckA
MTSDSRERETILLAEDDKALRFLVARILRGAGYSVIEAVDGEDALARSASHGRIDLLVTDMVMPKLGGVELARRLNVSNPDLRIMYMSGYPDAGLGKRGEVEPDTCWIAKPFAARDLLQEVRNRLDTRRTATARM